MTPEEFTAICKQLEHFETPQWAADEILKHEILTKDVIDPCCGIGVLTAAARSSGYNVTAIDIHEWGYPGAYVADYLSLENDLAVKVKGSTVYMNPPFSKACDFVRKSFEMDARKVVCFQRFAWWESKSRTEFWRNFPPSRIYICGDRATCYRHDISQDERSKMGNVPIPHAWFVFEPSHPLGTLVGHIRKPKA